MTAGEIVLAVAAAIGVLEGSWELINPDGGIHGYLRRRFRPARATILWCSSDISSPAWYTPSAVVIEPDHVSWKDALRASVRVESLPDDLVHVGPSGGRIDMFQDLGYTGSHRPDSRYLRTPTLAVYMDLANNNAGSGTGVLISRAEILISNYSQDVTRRRRILVFPNPQEGFGGEGCEIPIHRADVVVTSRGGRLASADSTDPEGSNLLDGKMYGLDPGQVLGFRFECEFLESGEYAVAVRLHVRDFYGRCSSISSAQRNVRILLLTAHALRECAIGFSDIWNSTRTVEEIERLSNTVATI